MSAMEKTSSANPDGVEDDYRFIPIQTPAATKDPALHRIARSHAVRRAIRKTKGSKRPAAAPQNTTSFPNAIFQAPSRAGALDAAIQDARRAILVVPTSLSPGRLDPFESLAASSVRLQELLQHRSARQATEPIFSVADQISFGSFRSVFRAGFDDPALVNALMLSLTFAARNGSMDKECLACKSQALRFIGGKMAHTETAATLATIGAILLLAGVEARSGLLSQVRLHMRGVKRLLSVCGSSAVHLNDGIKRAIFWQDLNASLLTGSERIVDHTTFGELQWKRDPFATSMHVLPAGFAMIAHLLNPNFIEVLEDIHSLQCIRESTNFCIEDPIFMLQMDNRQAWIESRLFALPKTSLFLECCYLACYACAYSLWSEIWQAQAIPSHLSHRLLRKLQQAKESSDDSLWQWHGDLLTWLLYMGGAFSPNGMARSEYIVLLHDRKLVDMFDYDSSWDRVLGVLSQFIWSGKAFGTKARAFWEEACTSPM